MKNARKQQEIKPANRTDLFVILAPRVCTPCTCCTRLATPMSQALRCRKLGVPVSDEETIVETLSHRKQATQPLAEGRQICSFESCGLQLRNTMVGTMLYADEQDRNYSMFRVLKHPTHPANDVDFNKQLHGNCRPLYNSETTTSASTGRHLQPPDTFSGL